MALRAGTRIGPYEITAMLGAGGMGEVYRARDTRLMRDVAIKVLPTGLASDAQRMERFAQEARATAALNHPNILAIYDVGSHEGAPYLVSELLHGQTLRERMSTGPIAARKTTEIALQITRGLAAAHARDIVHRDLKPENIFLTRDGVVKILDFGLAKLVQKEAASAAAVDGTPTMMTETTPGMVLGTVGYMSPEQVRGQGVDQRSDLFSLGAILYEMLSGQRAFKGQTPADSSLAILRDDPADLITLNLGVSPSLDRIVRHCLEKNPDERFQSARDLGFGLESTSTVSDAALPAAGKSRWASSPPLLVFLGVLVLGNLLALLWWTKGRLQNAAAPGAVDFRRLTDFVGMEEFPAISPDGKSVVFTADTTGVRHLWIHQMAGGAPLQITHDPVDHLYPRWSQDSAFITYYTPALENEGQGTLWEVASLGGPPRRLANSISGADISHSGDQIAYFRVESNQIQLVVSGRDGSNLRVLMQSPPKFEYLYPRWSPDDKWIAFQHAAAQWGEDVYVVPSAGGEPRQLTHDSVLMAGFSWTPDGTGIIYSSARGSTIFYLPVLNLWQVQVNGGEARQLTFGDSAYENPDVDHEGRITVGRRRTDFNIWRFPVGPNPAENVRSGQQITQQTGNVQTPTVSPDDAQLAYLWDSGGHGNLWVEDLKSRELRQLTFERDPGITIGVPLWSPDGSSIAFAVTRTRGDVSYWVINPDGSNLHKAIAYGAWASWSGDSKWLYYSDDAPTRQAQQFNLNKISINGGTPVVVRSDGASAPAPARDGSELFYIVALRNVNGRLGYEMRAARPENGPSRLLARIRSSSIPIWQGLHPALSHDGKWLAVPLNDTFGTNIWLISTATGELRRLTDFGQRRTFIARRVSWSPDDRFIYASVGYGDADIMLIHGLVH